MGLVGPPCVASGPDCRVVFGPHMLDAVSPPCVASGPDCRVVFGPQMWD